MTFQCLRAHISDGRTQTRLETRSATSLAPGFVRIRARFSSLNYKDALAVTGQGKILRSHPMVPGIDVAGRIEESHDSRHPAGQEVLVTGCGLGELQDGGYSQVVDVPGDWVIPLPKGLSEWDAMALGTAGFTAALCIHRMEINGQKPEHGEILVTGASGGVGSLAVAMLARRGYSVVAVSGKSQLESRLIKLGANRVMDPRDLNLGARPLESARWAGAIDNVGGELLSRLVSHIHLWGQIACVGLAGGSELHASVMPLILRGVSLLGISSTNCPRPLRETLWERLAGDLKPAHLADIVSSELRLPEVPAAAERMLRRESWGRAIVRLTEP